MTNNLPQLASWTPKEHQSPSDLPIELQAAILDLKEFAIDFAARSSERRKQNEVPKLLYQYTDLNALMSIHQNREVWVSDAGFMNDPLEGTWIHRAAVEATDRHFIDSPVYPSCKKMISFMASDDAATSFVSTDQLNGDLAELYIRSEFGRAYIGSFTANGDLLSQWRGYGDGGAGVSIGLDLQPYALAYAIHDGDFLSVKLLQVVYDQDIQNAEMDWCLSGIRKIYDQHLSVLRNNSDAVEELGRWTVRSIDDALAEIRWEFKSPAYREEQEWRLVAPGRNMRSKQCYRVSGGAIVPYLKVPLPCDERFSPVKHLVLGPRCPDRAAFGFRSMLQGVWNTRIDRSALAYR